MDFALWLLLGKPLDIISSAWWQHACWKCCGTAVHGTSEADPDITCFAVKAFHERSNEAVGGGFKSRL